MFLLTGRYPYLGDYNYSSTSKKMLLIKWVSRNISKKYPIAVYLFTVLKDRCFILMTNQVIDSSPGKQKMCVEENFSSFCLSVSCCKYSQVLPMSSLFCCYIYTSEHKKLHCAKVCFLFYYLVAIAWVK